MTTYNLFLFQNVYFVPSYPEAFQFYPRHHRPASVFISAMLTSVQSMALYLKNVTLVGVLSATLNTSIAPLLAMDLRLSYAQIVTTVPSQVL